MAMRLTKADPDPPKPRHMTGEGLGVDSGEAGVPFRAVETADPSHGIPDAVFDAIAEQPPHNPPPPGVLDLVSESPRFHAGGIEWQLMDTAPKDRPIYTSADPDSGIDVLTYWRISRVKENGKTGWQRREYWASVLTNRALDAEPFCWRESNTALANRAVGGEAA